MTKNSHKDGAPLTAEQLRSRLDYDPLTGVLRWKVNNNMPRKWNTRYAGKVAGSLNNYGYRYLCIDKQKYYAASLAWLYVTGEWPPDCIDHKDGVRANDRFSNLRPATRAENQQNQALRRDNTTGFRGICFHKPSKRYLAYINANRKRIHLGYFDTPEEAHAAYLAAKQRLHYFQPIPRDLAS